MDPEETFPTSKPLRYESFFNIKDPLECVLEILVDCVDAVSLVGKLERVGQV